MKLYVFELIHSSLKAVVSDATLVLTRMVTNYVTFCRSLCSFLMEKRHPPQVRFVDTHCSCPATGSVNNRDGGAVVQQGVSDLQLAEDLSTTRKRMVGTVASYYTGACS